MKRSLFFSLPLLLAACQSAAPPLSPLSGPTVATIKVAGNQTYTWSQSAHAWQGARPTATFTGTTAANKSIAGDLLPGPAWLADDGSLVFATKLRDVPAPDAHSLPWQLLQATNHLGLGVFSTTTYIQRTQTRGGMPPDSPGTVDNQQVQVPYSATFIFYGPDTAIQPALTTQPAPAPELSSPPPAAPPR